MGMACSRTMRRQRDCTGLAAAQGERRRPIQPGHCATENGHGVQQDYAEAARLYGPGGRAGGRSCPNASWELCYGNGHGVQQDYAEAARLWGLAAAQGERRRPIQAWALCYNGMGTACSRIMRRQRDCTGLAAAQGERRCPNATWELCYGNGHGVQQDYAEAVRLCGLAAAQRERSRPVQAGLVLRVWEGRTAGLGWRPRGCTASRPRRGMQPPSPAWSLRHNNGMTCTKIAVEAVRSYGLAAGQESAAAQLQPGHSATENWAWKLQQDYAQAFSCLYSSRCTDHCAAVCSLPVRNLGLLLQAHGL